MVTCVPTDQDDEDCIQNAIHTGVLDLASRQLGSVPDSIALCAGLTSLTISCNSITALPSNVLNELPSLTSLDVGWNKLTELPAQLGCLTKLVYLEAAYNLLFSIPDQVTCLQQLEVLSLHDNQLTRLPAGMGHMQCLSSLDISYNQVSILPPDLPYAPSLTELKAEGNPLPTKSLDRALAIVEARASGQPVQASPIPALGNSCCSSAASVTGALQHSSEAAGQAKTQACPEGSTTTPDNTYQPDVLVVQDSEPEAWQQQPIHEATADRDLPEIVIHGASTYGKHSTASASPQDPGPPETPGSEMAAAAGVSVSDLMELPPACAAVMYRTLTSAQEGVREVQEGRPLSRGGTALTGSTRGPGLPIPRPVGTAATFRVGTARARTPTSAAAAAAGPARPHSRQLHTGGWQDASVSDGSRSSHWASSTNGSSSQLEGVRALLASSSSREAPAPMRGHPGLPRPSSAVSRAVQPSVQTAAVASNGTVAALPTLESLPAVTFPLTAGVRGMLRQLSGSRGRSTTPDSMAGAQAAVDHDGAVVSSEQATQGSGDVHEDSDTLDTVRQLLAARNPAMLARLHSVTQQLPNDGAMEGYLETDCDSSDGEEG